jgi:hypothetical protein
MFGGVLVHQNKKKGKNSMSIAFEMGKKAFYGSRFSHPYKKETILAKEWQRGWDRAYFDQLKNPVLNDTDVDRNIS